MPDVSPSRPMQYVKVVRSKGHTYAYFDNGDDTPDGPRYERLPDLQSPSFQEAYAARLAARVRREFEPKDLADLIRRYQLSPAYLRLSARTQTLYQTYLARIEGEAGEEPVASLTQARLEAIASSLGAGARTVFCKAVGILFTWAIKEGHAEQNPADGMQTRKRPLERIYFIGTEDPAHPIKIGRATSVERRLATLQSSNPHRLIVLASYETANAVAEERKLHERFAAHRIRGEWFIRHPEIEAEVQRCQI